jgi:small subunit ribosomal protein S3Ae
MAKKKQIGRRVEGWKAKSWYKVYAPDILGKTYLGDTIAADPNQVVGRVMGTTLGEVVNDYGKQHVKIRLRINSVAGDAAYTEFVGHEISRDYLRSMVKRRTSRIDCHIPYVTRDGKRVMLTVTAFTLSRAEESQEHAIRKMITESILALLPAGDINTLINGILSGDISKELFKQAKLIYPIRRIEITKSKVEVPGQALAAAAAAAAA